MQEDFTTVALIGAAILLVVLISSGHWILFLAALYCAYLFMRGKKLRLDTDKKNEGKK